MYFAEMNERGQITLPAKLRRELGLVPYSQLVVTKDENGLSLRPILRKPIPIKNLFGSIKIKRELVDPELALKEAKKGKAKRTYHNE